MKEHRSEAAIYGMVCLLGAAFLAVRSIWSPAGSRLIEIAVIASFVATGASLLTKHRYSPEIYLATMLLAIVGGFWFGPNVRWFAVVCGLLGCIGYPILLTEIRGAPEDDLEYDPADLLPSEEFYDADDSCDADRDGEWMVAVSKKALAKLDRFIGALAHPSPTQTGFQVRAPFENGEATEHLWLCDVRFDGTSFHGVVDGEPEKTTTIRKGDRLAIAKEKISDWMYIDDGTMIGNETLRAVYK
ncbi:MAG TPA: DUF2314 domain-containing protein, partial [Planctomycetia bacterium]|nr:DUF2314 domain-containing protein [Planctomycetia bacterium]